MRVLISVSVAPPVGRRVAVPSTRRPDQPDEKPGPNCNWPSTPLIEGARSLDSTRGWSHLYDPDRGRPGRKPGRASSKTASRPSLHGAAVSSQHVAAELIA